MTPAQNDNNVGIAGSIQMGPDGKQWGVLHITSPLVHTALLIPENALGALATALPELLADLAKEVDKANNGPGLTVAPADALHALNKNGHNR